ncbi:hypothetical protein LELG_01228 [Lodderomyces elongisporus NRRL YB-4239]|uniref:AAA+ ATPase domain-containing protein n=1 Tax=Lodderomyces elongisporus (strain ATCC 11503 / CBS 2605 / JCM 1781 / NBRC 1676 / NRRL YB-4239) TaxID=379508 RepID=A5DV42_LODEL|nr:hypothetical protein LELG_01228 [Lodderomyces elongisporus NRRL YB-4239]
MAQSQGRKILTRGWHLLYIHFYYLKSKLFVVTSNTDPQQMLRPIIWRSRTLQLLILRRGPLFSSIIRRLIHASPSQLRKAFNPFNKDDKFYEQYGKLVEKYGSLMNNVFREDASLLDMKLPPNPFDQKYLQRLSVVYEFMLDEFELRCKEFAKREPNMIMDSTIIDQLFNDIKSKFEKEHPDIVPPSNDEITEAVRIYYALANNIAFLDQMQFTNDKVQALLSIYDKARADDKELDATKSAESLGIETEAAHTWFKIFETLESTSLAVEGTKRFPLCPQELFVLSNMKILRDRLSQMKESGNPFIFPNEKNNFFGEGKSGFNSFKRSGSSGDSDGKDPNTNGSNRNEQNKDRKSKNKNNKGKEENTIFEADIQIKRVLQAGFFILLSFFLFRGLLLTNDDEITFQTFVADYLSKNRVSKVIVVNNSVAYVELNDVAGTNQPMGRQIYFTIGSVETFERNLREAQDRCNIAPSMRVPVVYTTRGNSTKLLMSFVPTVLFLGAIYWMTKKAASSMGGMGGPMGFGKSTAKKFNQETEVKTKFKDVAGMEEAKQEVAEFVSFLKDPEKYEKLGAKIPRGAILSGPPGTGKTLLARATAGEAGVPFYSVSGSEFVEMFVGVGASRVRDLFKTARENAPSIVFVDEIDAIGKQRAKGNMSGANDERETTLNQLLVEMDGFDSTDHVVVLAGTNRPDILDKALMRPGRFDRHVHIDNPELQGRKEIFDVHLRKITLQKNIDRDLSGRLAALTPGFSGADIANVCNEAALIAARFNADSVTLRHFELAIERVIGGVEKKSKLLNPEEQRIVAFHEAGHAICGWYLKHAHPLLKVSIIPRGLGTLGYAQYLPPDQYLMSAVQLYDRMIMTLGGRVSEELNFASVTSGAHDDFKKVTNIAQSMVLRFGMSPEIGMVNYADTRSQDDLTKPFSDSTSKKIDNEVQRIVNECYTKCKELLTEKSHEVNLVAQELLKKEFITREDMIRLLGKRPFQENNDAFDKYLDGKAAFKDEKPENEHRD